MSNNTSAKSSQINSDRKCVQPGPSDKIICQYQNNTSAPQAVCISNIDGYFFERTVFPEQKLLFETFVEAVLEIRTGVLPGAIACDRIPCLRLRVAAPLPAWPCCTAKIAS